jgi:hypothetical protein
MTRARWVTMVAAVVFVAFASTAMADTISVGLQESGVNGGAITSETSSSSGVAGITGVAYGTFTIDNISGTGAPFLTEGQFDSNSINASSSAAGTLTVYVTDSGVTLAGLPGVESFLSTLTENLLTSGWSVTEATYVDSEDGVFTTTTPLSSATFTSIGTQSLEATADITGQPFSITQVYTITATGIGGDNSTINVVAAPEPSSIVLLAFALLSGLLFMRKRVFA